EVVLGPDIERGQQLQRTVPAGTWQGARIKEKARAKCQEPRVISCAEEGEGRVAKGERWALMGTTVAPPFDRAGFEAGVRAALLLEYPAEREAIVRLTTEEA
ncbi:cupin domain-containing protein, partial [candidate division WOR-3 bacterium]|nr:cupin domain-containing protein [candidate division WOR-3 bacterium]